MARGNFQLLVRRRRLGRSFGKDVVGAEDEGKFGAVVGA